MLAVCLFVVDGRAEEDLLSGAYVLVPEQSGDIAGAIDASVAKMNFMIRSMARSRLRENNVAYARVGIARTAAEIEVRFDDDPPVRAPASGAPIAVTNGGDRSEVSAVLREAQLIQTFKAKDGTRTNTFRWDAASARLYLDVTTSSERLPQPVKYTLVYRRAT